MGCGNCANARSTERIGHIEKAGQGFNYKKFPLWKRVFDYLDVPGLCAAGSTCRYCARLYPRG